MGARVDRQEILLSMAVSFHRVHWFSTNFFLLIKMFEYYRILLPILIFTKKRYSYSGSGLKGGQGQAILLCGSAIGRLTRKTKTMQLPRDREAQP